VPPVVVELTQAEVREAQDMAAATHGRYAGQAGHYRNLARSHLLGKLGEVAVEKWLRSAGLQPDAAYRDPTRDREPDLLLNGDGVEVKTWRPDTWDEWGRCVTPAQASGVARKSRAIVWAVARDEADPVTVELVGWSTPEDVVSTDPRPTGPAYRPVMNHQVEMENLRDLAELPQVISSH
jgi:hypothetical protein